MSAEICKVCIYTESQRLRRTAPTCSGGLTLFPFTAQADIFIFAFLFRLRPAPLPASAKEITAARMQAFSRRKEYGNLSEFLSQTIQKCLHLERGYAIMNKLILKRPCGQAAKTAPSHGAIPGSIPGKVTTLNLNRTTPLRVCAV